MGLNFCTWEGPTQILKSLLGPSRIYTHGRDPMCTVRTELSMHTLLWGPPSGPHAGWGIERSSCGLLMYEKSAPSNHPSSFMNGPQIFTIKSRCTIDPTIQSIWMDANPGLRWLSGVVCVVHSDGPSSGPHYEVPMCTKKTVCIG